MRKMLIHVSDRHGGVESYLGVFILFDPSRKKQLYFRLAANGKGNLSICQIIGLSALTLAIRG